MWLTPRSEATDRCRPLVGGRTLLLDLPPISAWIPDRLYDESRASSKGMHLIPYVASGDEGRGTDGIGSALVKTGQEMGVVVPTGKRNNDTHDAYKVESHA